MARSKRPSERSRHPVEPPLVMPKLSKAEATKIVVQGIMEMTEKMWPKPRWTKGSPWGDPPPLSTNVHDIKPKK